MPTSATGTNNPPPPGSLKGRRDGGFTLLELLVVIVIVAILFSFATLAIRGHDPDDALHTEARRLARLIELGLDEAVLRGENLAIEINSDGYRFLRLQDDRWTPMDKDRQLRPRALPENMEMELSLEDTEIVIHASDETADGMGGGFSLQSRVDKFGEDPQAERDEKAIEPQLYLLASGEITPEFSLYLGYPDYDSGYRIDGHFDGAIEVRKSDL